MISSKSVAKNFYSSSLDYLLYAVWLLLTVVIYILDRLASIDILLFSPLMYYIQAMTPIHKHHSQILKGFDAPTM